MRGGCRRGFWLGALALGLAILPLRAQYEHGAFTGKILDEEGKPLAGATILIRALDLELERRTETDKNGVFYYGGFRPGRYHITVLRGQEILWAHVVTLPYFRETLPLDIDLKKLREAAEQAQRLDPALEEQRRADQEQQKRENELQRQLNLAMRHLNQGRPEQALGAYRAALEMSPDDHVLYGMMGAAAAAAGRREEALGHYRRALQLAPQEAAHHNNLAALLAEAGKLEEALAEFQRAAQLDPDRAANYFFNRGAALLNAGHPGEALAPLREAVRRDPTLPVAHYFLGLALLRTSPRTGGALRAERVEPWPGAVEAFRRYLELAPDGEFAPRAREILSELGVLPAAAAAAPTP